jgi:hypothetical protein
VTDARVTRGRSSEELAAKFFRDNGWPDAERNPASLPGSDVLGIAGVNAEVKARKGFKPEQFLSQAEKRPGLAVVIIRPYRGGPSNVRDWPAMVRFEEMAHLLKGAGY